MLYIMRRTQLYLEDDLWQALHTRAAIEKTTVSHLVRTAARDRYLGDKEKRRAAMMAVVGLWSDHTDLPTPKPMSGIFATTIAWSDSD